MAEIKVGQQWRNLRGYYCPTHLQEGDITTVTKIEFEGHRIWFNPSPYDVDGFGGHSHMEAFVDRFELVEELEPLKLEHLKVGQLVIRKFDGWQRLITDVVEDRIWYLSGFESGCTAVKSVINATDFLKNFRLPDISEVAQFKKDNPETFAEYSVTTPSLKVGDYLTEGIEDIVWKVTEVGEAGSLLTEALMIQDADDVVDTYRLGSVTLSTMKKATPEQIEAFENHPYWGKQEPVADAISPSVYQFPNGVEVRSVSSTGAEKGVKASRFSLLPMEALTEVANHYGVGATKYEDHNMRRGYEWSKSYDALMRHATQFWSGEDNDEETGSKHLAAVVFHALTLMEFMETHPEFDDRYKLTK